METSSAKEIITKKKKKKKGKGLWKIIFNKIVLVVT